MKEHVSQNGKNEVTELRKKLEIRNKIILKEKTKLEKAQEK